MKFYYKIPEKAKKEDLERQRDLEADLSELQYPQGIEQLRMLRQKLDNLTEVLKRRLNAGELTFGRYLLAAQQVYLSAVDNIHDVAVVLRSVSTIDQAHIDDRLSELRKLTEPTEEQIKEVASLEQRNSLLDQQMTKVADLMSQNESAMTVLDKTAAAFAETKTGTGRAALEIEEAVKALETLAKRAHKYGR